MFAISMDYTVFLLAFQPGSTSSARATQLKRYEDPSLTPGDRSSPLPV
ncbi:MAG: hypothetical protein R2710_25720 [Acidimicrobiales bacterium]